MHAVLLVILGHRPGPSARNHARARATLCADDPEPCRCLAVASGTTRVVATLRAVVFLYVMSLCVRAQPHAGDSLTVQFGSTLNLPANAASGFYGVSSLQLYIRV